jgi:uncharacterized membrane protein YozB (DUF420 family)
MFNLCHKSEHCQPKKTLAILTIVATITTAVLLIVAIWIKPQAPETLMKLAVTSFIFSCLFFVSFLVTSFYKK